MAKIRETASSLLENWVRVTKFCFVFLFCVKHLTA
jgi:hypothetical protein